MLRKNKSTTAYDSKQHYEFKVFKKVGQINEGSGFGELALRGKRKHDRIR